MYFSSGVGLAVRRLAFEIMSTSARCYMHLSTSSRVCQHPCWMSSPFSNNILMVQLNSHHHNFPATEKFLHFVLRHGTVGDVPNIRSISFLLREFLVGFLLFIITFSQRRHILLFLILGFAPSKDDATPARTHRSAWQLKSDRRRPLAAALARPRRSHLLPLPHLLPRFHMQERRKSATRY